MKEQISIDGVVATEPYARKLKNGDLTQFLFFTTNASNNYISVVIREKIVASVGDMLTVCGSIREREFYHENEIHKITELIADSIHEW